MGRHHDGSLSPPSEVCNYSTTWDTRKSEPSENCKADYLCTKSFQPALFHHSSLWLPDIWLLSHVHRQDSPTRGRPYRAQQLQVARTHESWRCTRGAPSEPACPIAAQNIRCRNDPRGPTCGKAYWIHAPADKHPSLLRPPPLWVYWPVPGRNL